MAVLNATELFTLKWIVLHYVDFTQFKNKIQGEEKRPTKETEKKHPEGQKESQNSVVSWPPGIENVSRRPEG